MKRSVYLQRLAAMAPSVAGSFTAVLLFTVTGCGSKEGQTAEVKPPVNGVSGPVKVDAAGGDAATAGRVQQAQQDAAAQQARMNGQAAAGYAAAAAAREKSGGK